MGKTHFVDKRIVDYSLSDFVFSMFGVAIGLTILDFFNII